jgi:hypothetical protein
MAENLASQKILSAPAAPRTKQQKLQPKGNLMLWTVFVVILILWILGLTVFNIGNLVHLLLVVAVVVLIINLMTGRRSL